MQADNDRQECHVSQFLKQAGGGGGGGGVGSRDAHTHCVDGRAGRGIIEAADTGSGAPAEPFLQSLGLGNEWEEE